MRKLLYIAICLTLWCVCINGVRAQNRSIGAKQLMLDDGLGHTLIFQTSSPVVGGTLTFPGAGIIATQAYVQSLVMGQMGNYLPLSGGTMAGPIDMNGNGIVNAASISNAGVNTNSSVWRSIVTGMGNAIEGDASGATGGVGIYGFASGMNGAGVFAQGLGTGTVALFAGSDGNALPISINNPPGGSNQIDIQALHWSMSTVGVFKGLATNLGSNTSAGVLSIDNFGSSAALNNANASGSLNSFPTSNGTLAVATNAAGTNVATATTAGNVAGIVALSHGGTGVSAGSASVALNALLPAQSGATTGKVLTSDGTNASWQPGGGGGGLSLPYSTGNIDVPSQAVFTITNTSIADFSDGLDAYANNGDALFGYSSTDNAGVHGHSVTTGPGVLGDADLSGPGVWASNGSGLTALMVGYAGGAGGYQVDASILVTSPTTSGTTYSPVNGYGVYEFAGGSGIGTITVNLPATFGVDVAGKKITVINNTGGLTISVPCGSVTMSIVSGSAYGFIWDGTAWFPMGNM